MRTRSSTLSIRLLGTFCRTDVLIREILSWASIADLHEILLLNSYFSDQAKQCELWKQLLGTVPIPSFHVCRECETEYSNHEIDCKCRPAFDDPRIYSTFKDLSPYEKCTKLMPIAQICVKNLLLFYDFKSLPLGFDYKYEDWYNSNRGDISVIPNDAAARRVVRIETKYSKRWILLHNMISLDMAASERVEEFEPYYFLGMFCGAEMDPNTGSSFRDWYQSYIFPQSWYWEDSFSGPDLSVGSDVHLRLILCHTQEEWAKMATILGNKALVASFDTLKNVRENLDELLMTHPGPL